MLSEETIQRQDRLLNLLLQNEDGDLNAAQLFIDMMVNDFRLVKTRSGMCYLQGREGILTFEQCHELINGLVRFYDTFSDADIEIMNTTEAEPQTQNVEKRSAAPAPGYIYLLRGVHGHFKIGYSKEPHQRIERFEVMLPFPIQVMHLIPTNHMRRAEKCLHERFAEKRRSGEWFELSDEDVYTIKSLQSVMVDGIDAVLPTDVGNRS